MKGVVLIPTYNESENIGKLIDKIKSVLPELSIFVIDDNSPDGTSDIVRQYEEKYNDVKLIFRREKKGLGAAYIHGMSEAIKSGFDFIIMMDADFSHNPLVLPQMVKGLSTYDVIIGSRYIKGGKIENWPVHRKIISLIANFLIKIMLNSKSRDSTSGYRAIKTDVLKSIKYYTIKSQGYAFLYEMLWRIGKMGYGVKEIPIIFIDRKFGQTKISNKEIIRAFGTLIKLMFKQNF